MATFSLTITLGNEEMQTPSNIADVLTDLADDMLNDTAGHPYERIELIGHARISGNVTDANGNNVGTWRIL